MKIKNVETKNNIFLAPMAGVTTPSFRKICASAGAGLVYAEMVSDKGILYDNKKTLDMLEIDDGEHPIAMQLFGSDVVSMSNAARVVDKTSADIIDINMGCPVNKVVRGGGGSALLKDPNKIYDIVKCVVDNTSKPVSVKIRLGWDHEHINCVEVAKKIEAAGASAIAVHARTRSDLYNGKPIYHYIKDVKEAVNIPVIGNGDITDIESAKTVLETGCDGIMIGRAACGNPWIFTQLNAYFNENKIIEKPTKDEILDTLVLHATKLKQQKGEYIAVVEMRTHAAWYLKNLINAKEYKVKIVSATTFVELLSIVDAIRNNNNVYAKN